MQWKAKLNMLNASMLHCSKMVLFLRPKTIAYTCTAIRPILNFVHWPSRLVVVIVVVLRAQLTRYSERYRRFRLLVCIGRSAKFAPFFLQTMNIDLITVLGSNVLVSPLCITSFIWFFAFCFCVLFLLQILFCCLLLGRKENLSLDSSLKFN